MHIIHVGAVTCTIMLHSISFLLLTCCNITYYTEPGNNPKLHSLHIVISEEQQTITRQSLISTFVT